MRYAPTRAPKPAPAERPGSHRAQAILAAATRKAKAKAAGPREKRAP